MRGRHVLTIDEGKFVKEITPQIRERIAEVLPLYTNKPIGSHDIHP